MIGTKLGHYEITRHLGSGGMGDVYQATDTKLGRSVAIKLLPGALIHDAERLARFRREARVLASLNHPHICVLHEMATHEGIDYIVMEHLTGVPLSDRLSRGALPLDQALRYAIEIADALDKAHRQGVVHRDLKPANIMITSFGAKLLDFGLAKLRANGSEGAEGVSGLGTGEGLTVEGTIVGTLQYMAPEQLEGREADVRADIFSFGAILYEMLSGKKAFEGQSQASLIAAILKAEPPPISSLQPIVPPALDNLVRGCLSKDASDRWQTMHDVAKQLQWLSGAMTAAMPIPVPKRPRSFRVGIGAALVLAMVALAVLAFVYRRVPAGPSMRLTVAMPPAIALAVGENSPSSAVISPDGTRMVLMGVDQTTGKISLYVRAIDSVELQPLPGTEDAASPFWSPDSLSVAFFAQGKLQRVDLNGGPAKVICAAANSGAGTWNEDDVIVVSLSERGPLFRVSADGGTPTTVTSMNSATELDHDWPQFLPDGKHFLYVALSRNPAEQAIYVGSIDSQRGKLVAKGIGSPAVYAHPGHLLFFRAGALMVQAFDTEQMVLMGEPHRLAANAMPPFSASGTGTITYRGSPGTPDRFLWIDWEGRELGPVLQPGYYADPVLSPDGLRLAFARRETAGATFDIWILEFSSGRQRKLTTDTDDDRAPVWSPDGNSIAFWAKRQSGPGVYRKNSDGTGEEELVVPEKNDIWPYQWTGSNLLYFGGPGVSSYDAFLYSFADRKSRPLIQSPFVDADAATSPDGKWLAYETNETGRYEVYVSTFPTSNTKLVVTTESGVDSLWSPDGRTLFYVNAATRELLATEVKPGNPPEFGAPRRIYAGPLDWTSAHSFDIDARQKRILVQVSSAPQIDITVLLNWPADLKK